MSPEIVRDALTRVGYATLAGWGWFIYGFGTMLPLLRDEQGVSRTVISLHSVALASGAPIAGVAAVWLSRRVGRRWTVLGGCGLVTLGVVLLVTAPGPLVSLPAALICGLGGSALVNTVNPALSEHHGAAGAAALAEGNAVAAATGVVSPLLVGLCTSWGLTWRPAIALSLVFLLAVALLVRQVPAGLPALDTRAVAGSVPVGRGRMPVRYRVLLLTLMCCVAVEFALTTWSPDLLRQQAGMAAGPASFAVTALLVGMLAGRLLVGRLARRRDAAALLLGALGTTAAGWLVAWLATAPALAMAGLVLTGLGIAGHYPLAASLVLQAAAGRSDQASGAMSIGIGLSAGGAPFALAALADRTSTHTAFLVVPLLLAVAAGLLTVAGRSAPAALR